MNNNDYPFYPTGLRGEVLSPGSSYETSVDQFFDTDEPIQAGVRDDMSPDDALERFMSWDRLSRFTTRERQVVILTYVCSMNGREVASYLGIRPGAVRAALARAKSKGKSTP